MKYTILQCLPQQANCKTATGEYRHVKVVPDTDKRAIIAKGDTLEEVLKLAGLTSCDPAPRPTRTLRSITKNELADRINTLGKAAPFLALVGNLSPADRLKWDATPTVSPDYPFIKENRATILSVLGITSEQLDSIFI